MPDISAPIWNTAMSIPVSSIVITDNVKNNNPPVASIINGFLPYWSLSGPKYSTLNMGGKFNRIVFVVTNFETSDWTLKKELK